MQTVTRFETAIMYFIDVFRFCCKSLLYILASVLVVIAISLSAARVLLPNVEDYKADIEVWISESLGQQVEIATLDATWYGFEPQLVLKGVRLLSDDRMQIHGYFQQARLGIDLFSSVLEGRVSPGAFTLEGARFVLIRQKDGSISLQGLNNSPDSSDAHNNRLLDEWFFKQRFLEVKDSEIVWVDLTKSEKHWVFSDVNLRFRNDGSRHWVNGWVNLPDSLGARLKIALDVKGSLLSADAWSGTAYIESEQLKIFELSQYFPFETVEINDGEATLRLWSEWRNAELHALQGDVNLSNLQISAKNAPEMRVISQLSANFSALKKLTDWEVTLDKVLFESGRSAWPETRLDVKYNSFYNRFHAEVAYIDLKEMLPIARLFTSRNSGVSKAILGMKPTGIVTNLNVSAYSSGESYNYFATGVFSNLNNRSWGEIPGVDNLEGQFKISNLAASISIPTQNIQLDYTQKFLLPHRLKNLKASIYSSFDDSGFQLVAKDAGFILSGANIDGSFKFEKLKENAPKLDLVFYFNNAQISDAKYFVPAKIMPQGTVDWLSHALQSGEIKQGGLLYFGELGVFPLKTSEGLFNVSFNVDGGELKFADDWPAISAIAGKFDLNSRKLSFDGESGLTKGAMLKNVRVEVPDFHTENKYVTIVGNAYGETNDKLSYLFSTPLAQELSSQMTPLSVLGKSELALDLTVPLLNPEKTKYYGELLVTDNHVLADEWKLDIKNVSGSLRFNNDGFWSDDFQGEIRQTEIKGLVETVTDEKGSRVAIRSTSMVSNEKMTDLLGFFIDKAHWGEYFLGVSEIEANVIFPLARENKPIQLVIKSDMNGMGIDLPYPLRKPSEDSKNFLLSVDLTGGQRHLEIDYGSTHAVFEIFATAKSQQIIRGGIGFREKAALPEEIGYRFSGKLKKFAWDEWGPLLIPEKNKKTLLDGDGGGGSGSIYFAVDVDEFSLFGSKFGATSIQASHISQSWSMHLSGKELEGNITVPVVMSSAPMIVNMSRLHVNPEESEVGEKDVLAIDPRQLPELKLKVADFKYKDLSFGSLEVIAKKTPDGLRLNTFSMKNQQTTVSAEGDWAVTTDKGQLSQFNIVIDSSDIGRAITNWGYGGAIGGGEGEIKLDVSWPGQPLDFSFETASGDVAIAINNASMLGFDLGAARMFGLFLPRRLLLDFRDVFKKGMHFDEIKGKYNIEAGEAFTTGLFLKGPIADIHMAGRLGLSKRDFDQVVTINRRIIGDSVPVLAALAVVPLVAAQVFIVKKMFEQQIEDILSIQYTIEGSWDEPVITRVIKNVETGEDVLDDIFDE